MNKPAIIRQGDVLVVPCKSIPAAAKAVEAEAGRLILARGEATGHHHSLALSRRVTMFRDESGGAFLDVKEPVSLEHQEHTTLPIAPGKYEVRIQRTMQSSVAQRVAD